MIWLKVTVFDTELISLKRSPGWDSHLPNCSKATKAFNPKQGWGFVIVSLLQLRHSYVPLQRSYAATATPLLDRQLLRLSATYGDHRALLGDWSLRGTECSIKSDLTSLGTCIVNICKISPLPWSTYLPIIPCHSINSLIVEEGSELTINNRLNPATVLNL